MRSRLSSLRRHRGSDPDAPSPGVAADLPTDAPAPADSGEPSAPETHGETETASRGAPGEAPPVQLDAVSPDAEPLWAADQPDPAAEPSESVAAPARLDAAPADPPAAASSPETPLVDAPVDGVAAPPTVVVGPSPAPADAMATAAPEIAGEAGLTDVPAEPGFRVRGRLRRRLRYLRRVRELGLRDLGGLVFELHRFDRRGEQLVAGKLEALGTVDREVRLLEEALHERRELVILREPGLAACPRCAALHGSDANFCPGCGLSFSGRAAALPEAAPAVMDALQVTAVQPSLEAPDRPAGTP